MDAEGGAGGEQRADKRGEDQRIEQEQLLQDHADASPGKQDQRDRRPRDPRHPTVSHR